MRISEMTKEVYEAKDTAESHKDRSRYVRDAVKLVGLRVQLSKDGFPAEEQGALPDPEVF